MKKLSQFCDDRNLVCKLITYRAQGITLKRKGYDIVANTGNNYGYILASLEPCHYSNGDRWMIHFRAKTDEPYTGGTTEALMYAKNISQALNKLKQLNLNNTNTSYHILK